jgi:hypothetical protein
MRAGCDHLWEIDELYQPADDGESSMLCVRCGAAEFADQP